MPSSSTLEPHDVAATFAATLVDEWALGGVRHAVIAPGSRSTPLALALASHTGIKVDVFHDERSASFAALGIGLATGVPAVLLCSSGTAAAHFHAAVIEAHQSAIPMIVCTADRPPELRDVGAPQTIDQTKLYGGAVRWFCDPGIADDAAAHTWRSTAGHALSAATGTWPGPVHLNLPFREPLIGEPGQLPARRSVTTVAVTGPAVLDASTLATIADAIDGRRGVIVAGRGCGDPAAVAGLAAAAGWPVLADARSGLRTGPDTHGGVAITAFDSVLRHVPFASAHRAEVVVHLGEPPASKVLARWLAGLDATQIHISALPGWRDPDGVVDTHVTADVAVVCASLAPLIRTHGEVWLDDWKAAERAAQIAISAVLEHGAAAALTEPATARLLGRSLPEGAHLVVSSSMPVRDVEWYASQLGDAVVHSNRGANGIDGVVATAIGVALASGSPTVVLIGDVALLHDSSSLVAIGRREIDLRIVVIDNDGGGIFSFLPQATSIATDRFEQLFGTPHGADFAVLAGAHSIAAAVVATPTELLDALAKPGPRMIVVHSERSDNVAVHDEIHTAVAEALLRGE